MASALGRIRMCWRCCWGVETLSNRQVRKVRQVSILRRQGRFLVISEYSSEPSQEAGMFLLASFSFLRQLHSLKSGKCKVD